MKILHFCQKPPSPPVDGGCLASLRLAEDMKEAGFEVDLIALTTQKHPYLKEKADQTFLSSCNFQTLDLNTERSPLFYLTNLFSKWSVQEGRFYSNQAASKLEFILKSKYDYIVLDGLMTAFYLPDIQKQSDARIIYRSHNIEYKLLSERGSGSSKWYFKIQGKRLKEFEESIWEKAHLIWSISPLDSELIRNNCTTLVETLPFTLKEKVSGGEVKKNTVFHLGAMDWEPNRSGIKWFLDLWPSVLERCPDAELHLAGKGIADYKHKLTGKNILIHENVDSSSDFMDKYDIMIIPVQEGSGIRVKLLEALSRKKAIVSTVKGAEGVEVINRQSVLIADNADEFTEHLTSLLLDKNKKESIEQGAFNVFRKHYTSSVSIDLIRKSLGKHG